MVTITREMSSLVGEKFGKLTVVEETKNNRGEKAWLCKCDCGSNQVVKTWPLKNGKVSSCGCGWKKRHGLSTHPLYNKMRNMKKRCYNPNSKDYKDYGARGIKICKEWLDDFNTFYDWAIESGWKDGLTIDRIDVDGDYEPSNCQWQTRAEQNRNQRKTKYVEINGDSKLLGDWAKQYGLAPSAVWSRYNRGVRGADLLKPTRPRKSKKKTS